MNKEQRKFTTQYRNYQFVVSVYGKNAGQHYFYAISESPEIAKQEVVGHLNKHGIYKPNYNFDTEGHGYPVKLLSKKFLIDIHDYADPLIKNEKAVAAKQKEADLKEASRSAKLTVGAEEIKRMKHMI